MNKDSEPQALGECLRAAREQAGMSQRKLAREVGVDNAYVFRLENGAKRDPSADLLQRIADATGADAAQLLAFIGVKSELPEPRVYFRRKFGVNAEQADILAQLIEDHQAEKGGEHEETNED